MRKVSALFPLILAISACSGGNFDVSGLGGDDSGAGTNEAMVDSALPPDSAAPDTSITDSGVSETAEDSSVDVLGDSASDAGPGDTAPDSTSDAPVYPPLDPCAGVGGTGDVVIGVCRPHAGGPVGYLGVAARIFYYNGVITPNEEWADPWNGPGCSASVVEDCTCCKIRPTNGQDMPRMSTIDFETGVSLTPGGSLTTVFPPTGVGAASVYGYWGPTLVGRILNGVFDPAPNALGPAQAGWKGNLTFTY